MITEKLLLQALREYAADLAFAERLLDTEAEDGDGGRAAAMWALKGTIDFASVVFSKGAAHPALIRLYQGLQGLETGQTDPIVTPAPRGRGRPKRGGSIMAQRGMVAAAVDAAMCDRAAFRSIERAAEWVARRAAKLRALAEIGQDTKPSEAILKWRELARRGDRRTDDDAVAYWAVVRAVTEDPSAGGQRAAQRLVDLAGTYGGIAPAETP